MLTLRQLALLRGALRYFEEEMTPHALDVAAHYLETPLDPPLTAAEVRSLCELLPRGVLRYAAADSQGNRLRSRRLFPTLTEAEQRLSASGTVIATVLLFPEAG